MMKEIHEQPKAVQDTINAIVKDGMVSLEGISLTEEEIRNLRDINIVACGSAYHVGITLQYVIEDLTRIPVRVELGSEFRYRKPILSDNTLVIVISQSGETADSLAALREAKELGAKTLGIVNVIGSSIAREADNVLYTLAGPEIAVATTKAYSTQLVAGYLLGIEFGRVRGNIDEDQYQKFIADIQKLPRQIEGLLEEQERIQWFASKFSNAHDVFFIGRGVDYAICLEGSLKMKEISYVHSEAYAAGELKHGTISLIEDGTLVVGSLTQPASATWSKSRAAALTSWVLPLTETTVSKILRISPCMYPVRILTLQTVWRSSRFSLWLTISVSPRDWMSISPETSQRA